MLAIGHETVGSVLGLFGGIRTKKGRLDLKLNGLLPLVSGARVLALKSGSLRTATAERIAEASAAGLIAESDAALLTESHELIMRLILDQQIIDIGQGLAPGSKVEVKRLPRRTRDRLREALLAVNRIDATVQDALRKD